MGRREFYAIVDETYAMSRRRDQQSAGSWQGYDSDGWYQSARRKTGRKPG